MAYYDHLLQVTIYQPNGGKGFPVLDCPPAPPEDILICSYEDLPGILTDASHPLISDNLKKKWNKIVIELFFFFLFLSQRNTGKSTSMPPSLFSLLNPRLLKWPFTPSMPRSCWWRTLLTRTWKFAFMMVSPRCLLNVSKEVAELMSLN